MIESPTLQKETTIQMNYSKSVVMKFQVMNSIGWSSFVTFEFVTLRNPYVSTSVPTSSPTMSPTTLPTTFPSLSPSLNPSKSPTMNPTKSPMTLPLLIDNINVIVVDSFTIYVYWTSNAYMFEIMVYDGFNENIFNTKEDHHLFSNLIPATNYTMSIKTLNQNGQSDDINVIVKWITPEKKDNHVANAIDNNNNLENETNVITGSVIGGIVIGLLISLCVVLLKKQYVMTQNTTTIPEDVIMTNEQDTLNMLGISTISNPTYINMNPLDDRLSNYIEIDENDKETLYDIAKQEGDYAIITNDLNFDNEVKSNEQSTYVNFGQEKCK
jgi:hypothetical protein